VTAARTAIENGDFAAWREDSLRRLKGTAE
jgi:hypothetical protein